MGRRQRHACWEWDLVEVVTPPPQRLMVSSDETASVGRSRVWGEGWGGGPCPLAPPRSARPRRGILGGRGRPGRARPTSAPAAPQHPSARSESLSCASFMICAHSRLPGAPCCSRIHPPTLARPESASPQPTVFPISHGAAREPGFSPAMSHLPHFARAHPAKEGSAGSARDAWGGLDAPPSFSMASGPPSATAPSDEEPRNAAQSHVYISP